MLEVVHLSVAATIAYGVSRCSTCRAVRRHPDQITPETNVQLPAEMFRKASPPRRSPPLPRLPRSRASRALPRSLRPAPPRSPHLRAFPHLRAPCAPRSRASRAPAPLALPRPALPRPALPRPALPRLAASALRRVR